MTERGPERRFSADRRSGLERRFSERRQPERAGAGRRVAFPFDRRVAERRFTERRSGWPVNPDAQEAQAY
ncbi:MAG TPA: hypothetical protein VJR46_13140 [Candidatus Dormibacteraeota bacterium]|nr:hypothetical protein [Candidatus Dormibacteraeota bacterium]